MKHSTTALLTTSPLFVALALASLACGGQLDPTSQGKSVTPAPGLVGADDAGATLSVVSGTIAVGSAADGVTFYPPDAVTDTPPLAHLNWFPEEKYFPTNLAFDTDGALYVDAFAGPDANVAADAQARIDVFAPGSIDDAAPVRTIMGGNTGLESARAMVVDAEGYLYVANAIVNGSGSDVSAVLVFAPDANGDVAPVRRLTTNATSGLWLPSGLAMDVKENVFAADSEESPILEFAPISQSPIHSIGSSLGFQDPTGLAVDANDRLYVSDWTDSSVVVLAADGDGVPITTITGDQTGINLPTDVAIDHAGRIYVGNTSGGLRIFAPGASGNVAPVAVLRPEDGYNVAILP